MELITVFFFFIMIAVWFLLTLVLSKSLHKLVEKLFRNYKSKNSDER